MGSSLSTGLVRSKSDSMARVLSRIFREFADV